jgi:hypothetical protein
MCFIVEADTVIVRPVIERRFLIDVRLFFTLYQLLTIKMDSKNKCRKL